jgi:galactonate dehydratase
MKIRSMETFKVPPRWLFLKITTEDGIVGWGEPVVEGRADTVQSAVQEMSEYLIGKEAGHIEDTWQLLYRGGFYRGGPGSHQCHVGHRAGAVGHQRQSARRAGVRPHGRPVRDKMRVYAWIGGDRPQEIAQAAQTQVAPVTRR